MSTYFPLTQPALKSGLSVTLTVARGWEIFVRPRGGKEGETVTVYGEGKDGAAVLSQPLTTGKSGRIGEGEHFGWVKAGDLPLDVWGRRKGSSDEWQVLPEGDAALVAGGIAGEELTHATADVAVIKEAPLNVEYFGADGTGVADSTAAFNAAIAALPAQGGEIFAPRQYTLSEGLVLDYPKRSVKIRGAAALTSGTGAASQLLFTQGGSGTLISARSALGIILEDIRVWPTNTSFTGKLADFGSDGTHGQNTSSRLVRVHFNGPGGGVNAGTGLYIPNTADLLIQGCRFANLDYAIKGEQIEADNSIGIKILGGLFVSLNTMGIQNAGESWNVDSLVVEALANGKAGFLKVEEGITPRNLNLDSVWMGDANTEGTWVTWRGISLNVVNSTFGGGALGISLPVNEASKSIVTAKNNRFVTGEGIKANWGGGGGSFRYDLNPNDYSAVSGKKVSLDNGATDAGAGSLRN